MMHRATYKSVALLQWAVFVCLCILTLYGVALRKETPGVEKDIPKCVEFLNWVALGWLVSLTSSMRINTKYVLCHLCRTIFDLHVANKCALTYLLSINLTRAVGIFNETHSMVQLN